jgi:hypothetical protein
MNRHIPEGFVKRDPQANSPVDHILPWLRLARARVARW